MKSLILIGLILINSVFFSFSQKDTIFWFAAPSLSIIENHPYNSPIFLKLFSYENDVKVEISMPANPSFKSIKLNISKKSSQIIDLSPFVGQIESKPANRILNNGLLIKSTSPISVYYEAGGESLANPDIFTLKGQQALGKLFYIPFQNFSRNCHTDEGCEKSSFDIIATEDNTTIRIKPKRKIEGHKSKKEFQIKLNKGQVFSVKASGRDAKDHLGGSRVSSNKPITITMKDDLTNNFDIGYCQDLIGDQLISVENLGTEYLIIKGNLKISDRFYICATQSNTTITLNDSIIGIIDEGEMLSGTFDDKAAFIKSSSPICLLHTTGFGCEMGGAIIPPLSKMNSKEIAINRSTNEKLVLLIIVNGNGINGFSINDDVSKITKEMFHKAISSSNEWYIAKVAISVSAFKANADLRIKNSSSNFYLMVLNGLEEVTGCRYGYFSEFFH